MRPRYLLPLLGVGLSLTGLAVAQKFEGNRPIAATTESIFVGQSVRDAIAALNRRGIACHEGGFAFSYVDDQSNLHFVLDEEHTTVCAFFSKSRQVITGLSVVFYESPRERSKGDPMIAATRIDIHQDLSYGVLFSKPRTPEQIREAEANRPKSQYPPEVTPANR